MPKSTFTPGSLGAEALAYASMGIKIFPLWHAVDGVCQCVARAACSRKAKHPRVPHGLKEATSDLATVTTWWRHWPDAGIGLATEANKLAVIDVDPAHGGNETLDSLTHWCQQKHGIDLLATHTVRTGSGGLHLYYQAPPGNIKTGAGTFGPKAPGIDTRGRGGYVVAPPSVHACGGQYETINSHYGPARWPAVLTRLMERPTMPAAQREALSRNGFRGASTRWAAAALERECEHLAGLAEGERNVQLNHAAYKMGRRVGAGMLDEAETARALLAAASGWVGRNCTEAENRKTIMSGLAAGKANPHPGPARTREDVK